MHWNKEIYYGARLSTCSQIYIYIYLFHPRYLHNDIYRYVTSEISQDISLCYFTLLFHSVLCKLITLVGIATGQTFQFSRFLQPLVYPAELGGGGGGG